MQSKNSGPNRLLTSKARESIYAWLHAHGTAPLKEIKHACDLDEIEDVSKTSVGNILRKMVQLDALTRPKYGHYAINKELSEAKRDIRTIHFAVWDFDAQSTHDGQPIFDGDIFATMEFLCDTFKEIDYEKESGLWINAFDLSDSMYFNSLTLSAWVHWFNQAVYPALQAYEFPADSYPAYKTHFDGPCMVDINMSLAPHATQVSAETYDRFVKKTNIAKTNFDQLCQKWSHTFRSDTIDHQPSPADIEREVIDELNGELAEYDQILDRLIEENIELKHRVKQLKKENSALQD